ncbi:hypothetical protein Syun_013635 [Stephania yunnanensis]|uniref:Uncharacterized protein n=1 Tax=Stephania yunnanensis TaxID=152371 RepID=A0AAP0PB15_9MAGN
MKLKRTIKCMIDILQWLTIETIPSDPEANDRRLSGLDTLQVGLKPLDYE